MSQAETLAPLSLAETHPDEWKEIEAYLETTTTSLIIVSDFDEVIQNSAVMHWIATNEWLRENNFANRQMSYVEFCLAGGTGVFNDLPGYIEFNRSLRNSKDFHAELPPMPDANKLKEMDQLLALYLTTRPQVLADITRHHAVIDRPVIARPKDKDFNGTVEWKIGVLEEIVIKLGPDQKIVMIDDNWDLFEAINQLGNPQIISILFNGPLTLAQYEKAIAASPDIKLKFDALDWPAIVEKLNSNSN